MVGKALINLIMLLYRKNVLSKEEAVELLDDTSENIRQPFGQEKSE